MTDLWNPAANDGKGGLEYVPHTEAKDKLAQGYQLPIGRTLALVRPDGTVGKAVITKENAEAAAADLRAGARFASDDEIGFEERKDEYSDQNFKAALVGAANEATMGALGLIANEVAPSVAKDIRGLQEFSPTGYSVGSVAGAVLPALATGGASASGRAALGAAEAAEAVRATTLAQKLKAGASAVVDGTKNVLAATPQGALTTASEAAEALALGKGFSRGTAAALGYGLEGAAYGGIRTATEDALHNRELSAESFVVNAALGGLLGGGVGAASRVVPGALSKGYQGTKEGLKNLWMKKTGAELGDGVAEISTLEDVATRASRPLSEAGKRARRNIFVKSKEVGEYGSKLRQHIDQVEDVGGIAQDMMKGAAKRRNVEPLVKKGRPVKALDETMAVADDYLGFIDDLVEDGPSFGLPRSIGKQLRERANGYREAIIKAANSPGDVATDVFMIADGLKREIQSQANKFKRYETVFRRFEDQETTLRGLLENVDEFGEAANLQKNINATWSRLIANDNKFQHMFMEDSGEFLAYGTKRTASPQKIQGFLSGIGKFEKGLHEEVMNRQVQLQREFIETLSKYVDLDPSLSARLGTARQSASSAEKFLAEASEVMRDRNQYLELTSRPAAALFGGGVGGVLGYAGSGGEGEWALAGSAAGVLMNPAKRIQALAHWDSMAHMFTDKARKATQGYVKGLQRAKTGLTSVKPTAKDVEKAARAAYKPLSLSEYKKVVDAIKAYSADPAGVEEELRKAAGNDADAAPGTFGASVGVQMRALNYLASKIPESSMHTPEILPPKKRPVSDFERLKFSRIVRTLQKPERLLDDLKEGRLNREAVQAVQAVYPAMHAQIVETVIDEVQNAPQGSMTYQDKINLSFLLDVPLDKSMEPKHIAAIQTIVHAPTEEQQEPGGGMVSPSQAKAPNQSALSQTMSQGLIEEGY